MQDASRRTVPNWLSSLGVYGDWRVALIFPLGFSSGLPLLLTYTTLTTWLATVGIKLSLIGAFALVGTPYTLKFVWSPLIDRLPPPFPLGRRRGWGITIQIALIAAILALGKCDPKHDLKFMGGLAVLLAFLSASQDIVIDAWRVEMLTPELQGAGAAMAQAGYRMGMLVAGAGSLLIAEHAGWFAAYATMAALIGVGMIVFLFGPEPRVGTPPSGEARAIRPHPVLHWFNTAVVQPFADFMRRPMWLVILLFIVGYKLGEGMAAYMAYPLYVKVGFTLGEMATMSKIVGFAATVLGAFAGGVVTARFGILRALMVCGILQSLGNLFYVLQAVGGHRIGYLALCVIAEDLTGGMAGTALIAFLSNLCSPQYTATQYALLASLGFVGRTVASATSGLLVQKLGWANFFLLTTVITIPALLLLIWLERSSPTRSERQAPVSVSAA